MLGHSTDFDRILTAIRDDPTSFKTLVDQLVILVANEEDQRIFDVARTIRDGILASEGSFRFQLLNYLEHLIDRTEERVHIVIAYSPLFPALLQVADPSFRAAVRDILSRWKARTSGELMGLIERIEKPSSNHFSPFSTMVALRALRLLETARSSQYFSMQNMLIAHQAFHLVRCLDIAVSDNPSRQQLKDRIELERELRSIDMEMKKRDEICTDSPLSYFAGERAIAEQYRELCKGRSYFYECDPDENGDLRRLRLYDRRASPHRKENTVHTLSSSQTEHSSLFWENIHAFIEPVSTEDQRREADASRTKLTEPAIIEKTAVTDYENEAQELPKLTETAAMIFEKMNELLPTYMESIGSNGGEDNLTIQVGITAIEGLQSLVMKTEGRLGELQRSEAQLIRETSEASMKDDDLQGHSLQERDDQADEGISNIEQLSDLSAIPNIPQIPVTGNTEASHAPQSTAPTQQVDDEVDDTKHDSDFDKGQTDIRSFINGIFTSIRENSSADTQAVRELERRVTEIAADLKKSPNPATEKILLHIVHVVFEALTGDPKESDNTQLEIISNANRELDGLRPSPSTSPNAMRSIVDTDHRSIEHEIRELSDSAIAALLRINSLLPVRKAFMDPKGSSHMKSIVSEQAGINGLQAAIVQFSEKLEGLTDKGLIDKHLSVIIYEVEDLTSEPRVHNVSMDTTFGELAERLIVTPIKEQNQDKEDDEENDEEDDPPIDFWVQRTDKFHNVVTNSNHWWEHQDPQTRVSDAFPGETKCRVGMVSKHGEYVVISVDDGGVERFKVVEMAKKRWIAAEYLSREFNGRKILQILRLRDGTDISGVIFNRNNIPPHTNTVFVELEGADGIQTSRGKGKMVAQPTAGTSREGFIQTIKGRFSHHFSPAGF